MEDIFKNRCENDPQGVIADLVNQTSKQARAIRDLTSENEQLKELLSSNGIEFTIIENSSNKKKKGK